VCGHFCSCCSARPLFINSPIHHENTILRLLLAVETEQRLESILGLCLETLSWQFGSLDTLQLSQASQLIRPDISWRDAVVALPDIVGGITTLYMRLRRAQQRPSGT
jgi:hypothetical protein